MTDAAGVACVKICLSLFDDPDTTTGIATYVSGQYVGIVDGHEFVAYWEKVEGVCNFVVEWDEVEIARYIKCGPRVTVTCRNPAGEDLITGDGLLTYGPAELLELPHHEETTKTCQTLDIAFVVDDTGSMGTLIAALKAGMASIVTIAEAQSDSVQFSLLTFKDTVTEELAFSVGNSAAMISAINAVTANGGENIPEASDIALAQAVALTDWRYPSGRPSKRIIVLATDAPPGGTNDVQEEIDELNLIQAATDAKSAGIALAAVSAGPFAAPSLRNASTANGESSRFISSVEEMVDRIRGMIKGVCPDPAPCKTPYCGSCTCVPRKVCVKVTADCAGDQVVDANTDDDGCYIPEWDIDLDCDTFNYTGTIALTRNASTGACELVIPIAAVDEDDIVVAVSGCNPLLVSWEIIDGDTTYSFTLTSSICGECGTRVPFCCDNDETLPTTIYWYAATKGNTISSHPPPTCENTVTALAFNPAPPPNSGSVMIGSFYDGYYVDAETTTPYYIRLSCHTARFNDEDFFQWTLELYRLTELPADQTTEPPGDIVVQQEYIGHTYNNPCSPLFAVYEGEVSTYGNGNYATGLHDGWEVSLVIVDTLPC